MKKWDYNGVDNVVLEVSYDEGKEAGTNPAIMDADSSPYIHRLYAATPSSTTGSVGSSYGLVTQFDFETGPPPSSVQNATFELTVNNVDPVIDADHKKIVLEDGSEVDTVLEGQKFMVSNITFKDPALFMESEIFEYRVDLGNGSYGPWTEIPIGYGGESVVVPNNRETTPGNSNNIFPWYPSSGYRRYMQWHSSDQIGPGTIASIGFRPDDVYKTNQWTARYTNVKVYLSHTKVTSLSSTFASNIGSDHKLVYEGSFEWDHPANLDKWYEIEFNKGWFNYNGADNLIVDITYASLDPRLRKE